MAEDFFILYMRKNLLSKILLLSKYKYFIENNGNHYIFSTSVIDEKYEWKVNFFWQLYSKYIKIVVKVEKKSL